MQRKSRLLQEANKQLIMNAPLVSATEDNFIKAKAVETWTVNVHGEMLERTIIYLRSDIGCSYGVKTGGCTGCRHWRLGTAGEKLNIPDLFYRQYENAVKEYGVASIVCIYNEGNMLNEKEIPKNELLKIIKNLVENKVKRLVLESRPEYITEDYLRDIKNITSNKMEVEIGIGLESVNSFVRNELFLKAMSLSGFERSVKLMKKFSIRSLIYVIIKAPFLNEAQSIHDAIETTKYAFKMGVDAVSFESLGVEPHSIIDYMYQENLFKPAWIWSIMEVVNQTFKLGEVRIGGFQFAPPPEVFPKNCKECTDIFIEAINQYNLDYDIAKLNKIQCGCKYKYNKELTGLNSTIDTVKILESMNTFLESFTPKTA